jgi:hypothetical protein
VSARRENKFTGAPPIFYRFLICLDAAKFVASVARVAGGAVFKCRSADSTALSARSASVRLRTYRRAERALATLRTSSN